MEGAHGLLLEVGGVHQQRPAGSGTMLVDVVWTKRSLEPWLESKVKIWHRKDSGRPEGEQKHSTLFYVLKLSKKHHVASILNGFDWKPAVISCCPSPLLVMAAKYSLHLTAMPNK